MTRLIDFNYGMPALTEVNLHEGLEYIGESAFYQSMLLTELTIPSTVTTIDKYALSEIYNLETLIFKDGDKPLEFSESPFTYTVPKTIYLGREVTGNRLTFDASLCDNITFGPGIREIDPVLFTEARNITEVNVLAVEPPVLDDASFPSVVYSRATLYTPDGSTRDYCDAHGWKLFDNIFGAEYVITVSHNEGGKVAVNGDYASAVAVGRNSTPVVTVTVDDGYTLTSMSLNGEAIDIESGEDGVYTLSAMRDDAVLDVVFSKESLVSSVVMEDVAVTTRGGTITVSNFDGDMTVVALDGKVLYDGPARTITVQAAGVYFVKVGDKVFKVAVD